jgi:hypothetical protein
MFEALATLLARKNQRFTCRAAGRGQPNSSHTAHIRHEVGPPLDSSSLADLAKQVGDMPELLEFYRRYGTARLYCDTVPGRFGNASAYYIAPPETWAELRDAFSGWIDDLAEEEKEELLPEWIDSFVVVGEVPNSGNYFLVPLEGPERGKVFEFEHDGFEFIESGRNFADFLNRKSTVTDDLLGEILTHTRYSDGKSDTQWLCESYQHGQ